jgi:hypothetical protein
MTFAELRGVSFGEGAPTAMRSTGNTPQCVRLFRTRILNSGGCRTGNINFANGENICGGLNDLIGNNDTIGI